MKHLYTLCAFLVLSMQQTIAQSVVLNWATSLLTSWLPNGTSGSAMNIGSSSVNANISINNTQPAAHGAFSIFTSPRVTNSYATQLGVSSSNLAIGVDWTNKSEYADIIIDFTKVVKNVKFNVADIDRLTSFSTTYVDEITVTGTNLGTAVTNPTITKLVSGSDVVKITGNTATANTTLWQGGNSASSTTDQNGTVVINFGTTMLTQVRIRYHNNSASQNDPDEQFIILGNITFEPAVSLPLTLTSFNGAVNNNAVQLNWTTALEENLDTYVVEKSTNVSDWQTLSMVKATGNSNSKKEYNAIDPNAASVNYYRLKQIDVNGSYTYSQIIRIRNGAFDKTGIKLYPNPAVNSATVTINSEIKQAVHIKLYDRFGMQLLHLQRPLIAGSNNIPIPGITALKAGSYIICVENEAGDKTETTQFIKN